MGRVFSDFQKEMCLFEIDEVREANFSLNESVEATSKVHDMTVVTLH